MWSYKIFMKGYEHITHIFVKCLMIYGHFKRYSINIICFLTCDVANLLVQTNASKHF